MVFVLCTREAKSKSLVNQMDNPSLEINYRDVTSYIVAVAPPIEHRDSRRNYYSNILRTRIGYAHEGLVSRLLGGEDDSTQDPECMAVLTSLLISGFLPPENLRWSIRRSFFAEKGHELTNHLLDDEKIGRALGLRLGQIEHCLIDR